MNGADEARLAAELRRLAASESRSPCPAPERWYDLVAGRIDGEAAEALRAHLEGCPDCVEVARDALGLATAMAGSPSVARPRSVRRGLALAAAGLAAVALALWFGSGAQPPEERELARWSSGPLEPPRLAQVSIDDELLFRGAIAPGASERTRLQEGYALLAAGHAAEARAPLRAAAGAADAALADEARWYLALAELRAGDRGAAARALAPLLGRSGARAGDAAALSRALEAGP